MSAEAQAPARRVRPFYWSVRRELWENRGVFGAPLIAAAVVLVPYLFMATRLPRALDRLENPANAKAFKQAAAMMEAPFSAAAAFVLLASIGVAVFYSLAALQAERRDRSILFWKSLPVSDLVTVLSKAVVPIVILPLVALAVIYAVQLLMLAFGTLVVVAHGLDPRAFWDRTPFPFMWLILLLGLPYGGLWLAPVYAWFILVSAWAKRLALLWAVAPAVALPLVEHLTLGTHHVSRFLAHRLGGAYGASFSTDGKGKVPVDGVEDIDLVRLLTDPDLWGGLIVAALLLAAAVRLRRSREPI